MQGTPKLPDAQFTASGDKDSRGVVSVVCVEAIFKMMDIKFHFTAAMYSFTQTQQLLQPSLCKLSN